MNKGITLLILLVVLGAMGLVMYSHTSSGPPEPASGPITSGLTGTETVPPMDNGSRVAQGGGAGFSSPLQAPQGGSGGLRPIEPPLAGTDSARGNDGAPRPVTLTAGSDDKGPLRPVTTPSTRPEPARPSQTTPGQAGPGRTPSGQTATARPDTRPGRDAQAGTRPTASTTRPETSAGASAAQTGRDADRSATQPGNQSGGQTSTPSASQANGQPTAQTGGQTGGQGAAASTAQTATPGRTSGMPGLTAGPTPWDASSATGSSGGQASSAEGSQAASQATVPSGGQTALPPVTPTSGNTVAVIPGPNQPPVTDPLGAPSLPLAGSHALQTIHLGFAGQNMQLRIEADNPFPVKTFALTGPDRLVIDLPGTWSNMQAPSVPENSIVQKVRVGKQDKGIRLVLDLKKPLGNHSVSRAGNRVDVLVQ